MATNNNVLRYRDLGGYRGGAFLALYSCVYPSLIAGIMVIKEGNMRKSLILSFLILSVLFNNKVGECSLYNIDFQGSITNIITYPSTDLTKVEDILGVTIGSSMTTTGIYNTNPNLNYSSDTIDVYSMGSDLVFYFNTFTVTSADFFYINKAPPYSSIAYGDPFGIPGTGVHHEDGWWADIFGGSSIWFENKKGISYTLENFPTLLNTENFYITFAITSFVPGGLPVDATPPNPWASVFGVIDTVNVSPVPEPSTLLLMGSGLAGLVGIGRKRFKK